MSIDLNQSNASKFPPWFWRALQPSGQRRADFHNYKGRGSYLITILKAPQAPPFSTLMGDPQDFSNIRVHLSPLGQIIEKNILKRNNFSEFSIPRYVIMPDHIHILWQVCTYLPQPVGNYIGRFKSVCQRECSELLPPNAFLFQEGFNDRIALSDTQFQRIAHYITDNPRRRFIAANNPELFRRVNNVRIAGVVMSCYGNFQLLRNPNLTLGIISSRYSEEEKNRLIKDWREAFRNCGVFISPFISHAEKYLMQSAIKSGCSIIRIVPNGLGPRYKPSGLEFDLCAEGRCLHIGAPKESIKKVSIDRNVCLRYNDIARWIAANADSMMKILSSNE